MLRGIALVLYYAFARYLPTQPVPGWRMAYALRRWIGRQVFDHFGTNVIIKQGAYFGSGRDISIGHRAQIGHNSRIDHGVSIGDDVVMGPDVVIMTVGHAYADPAVPVNLQGALGRRPVVIGRDVWIGTRVIVLPGVHIGDGAIVGAGSVVTKSIAPYCVAAGNPARCVKWRRTPEQRA